MSEGVLGETSNKWDPWVAAEAEYPDVHIITRHLSGRLQGCVDVRKRRIWIDASLTPVEARCVLAFELGQLREGVVPDDPCAAAAHRRSAEEWAARMMVPLEDLLDGFAIFGHLAPMADWLEVDLPTLRARLRALTDDEQDAVMEAIRRWQSASA